MALSINFVLHRLKNADLLLQNVKHIQLSSRRHYKKTFLRFDKVTGMRLKEHPETPEMGEYEIVPTKGIIYDRLPFKVKLEEGKTYFWCTCGYGHTQPFCDGTHKVIWDRKMLATKMQPTKFKVEETKEYWLCNCKQTNNRPFCDGSHKEHKITAKKRT